MDSQIFVVIALTFVGFVALAFVLLYPVHRFLSREERAARVWTPDEIARRQIRDAAAGGDGAGGDGAAGGPPRAA